MRRSRYGLFLGLLFASLSEADVISPTLIAGVCSKMPTNCFKIYRPVCACDNTTYNNECDAKAAGVNVLYLGSCKGPLSSVLIIRQTVPLC